MSAPREVWGVLSRSGVLELGYFDSNDAHEGAKAKNSNSPEDGE